MVYIAGVQSRINNSAPLSFKKKEDKKGACENKDELLYKARKNHPVTLGLKIQANKLKNAFTTYPIKGLEGSKNSNFYEFLTMGMVPYLIGSGAMIAVFNAASAFFDTQSAVNASKIGKKMGLGVLFYGVAKTLSKKLIETPVNLKYGIDVNLPYKKVINELPEKRNKDDLVSYEYHKAYESVDFPRWDLFYNNKDFGENRNDYYLKVGKKMGFNNEDLEHADQKVKPVIKEKVIKTRLFSTLSSYLWAATGVGIASQKPWENFVINPSKRFFNFKNSLINAKKAKEAGNIIAKNDNFVKDFAKTFAKSTKEFVKGHNKSTGIAGKILLSSAICMTLLGNFSTLFDFNKYKGNKIQASASIIDENKNKVVC